MPDLNPFQSPLVAAEPAEERSWLRTWILRMEGAAVFSLGAAWSLNRFANAGEDWPEPRTNMEVLVGAAPLAVVMFLVIVATCCVKDARLPDGSWVHSLYVALTTLVVSLPLTYGVAAAALLAAGGELISSQPPTLAQNAAPAVAWAAAYAACLALAIWWAKRKAGETNA